MRRRFADGTAVLLSAVLWASAATEVARAQESAPPAGAPWQPAAVGRIIDIDINEGFLIVQFPSGPMVIGINKRALTSYRIGDEVRIDSAGRIVR